MPHLFSNIHGLAQWLAHIRHARHLFFKQGQDAWLTPDQQIKALTKTGQKTEVGVPSPSTFPGL